MMNIMSDSSALIALRRSLERIEPRRAPAPSAPVSLGHAGIDAALGGGLERGRLHEVLAEEEEAGSGAGFTALLGLILAVGRPILWLRCEAAERKTGRLQAGGLGELGLDPAALLLGIVPDEPALLRAAAEASRCAGLGALLVECWGPMRGFDLTASRRLMLAAEASGVAVLVLRLGAGQTPGEFRPSAADTRWRAAAALSTALEADAPGAPMFDLELLRRRAGPPAGPWRVEWNRDQTCFAEPDGIAEAAPLPRPVHALVSGGAAEARRRAG
jgi:protein ImuA